MREFFFEIKGDGRAIRVSASNQSLDTKFFLELDDEIQKCYIVPGIASSSLIFTIESWDCEVDPSHLVLHLSFDASPLAARARQTVEGHYCILALDSIIRHIRIHSFF